MSIVYLLQNQHEQFLSKSREWVDGKAGGTLYRTEYKDEAINQKVEFSVKQADLRITLVEARIGKDGHPELLQGSNDDHASPPENSPTLSSPPEDDSNSASADLESAQIPSPDNAQLDESTPMQASI